MSATLTHPSEAPSKNDAGNDDPFLFRRLRTWWLLLAIFFMAQGNGGILAGGGSPKTTEQASSSSLTLLTIGWCVLCVGLMARHVAPTLRLMLQQKSVLAFAILACLSALWSEEPSLTFRRAILMFLTFVFAWFFASQYSPTDQMRLLLRVGLIVALASLAVAVLLPQYGIASGGEWSGIFGAKNRLGLAVLFLFSSLPFRRISSRRRLHAVALQATLAIGLILLSRSKGSLILTFVLLSVRFLGAPLARMRRGGPLFVLLIPLSLLFLIAIVLLTNQQGIVLSLLGKDATLTGRTEHWAILLTRAARHLWLGYGYQGFWTSHSRDLERVAAIQDGSIRGSDSGYVETILQFGLVGIGMLLVIILGAVRDYLGLFRRRPLPLAVHWYAGIVAAIFVGSITEVLFAGANSFSTFMFVFACAGLRKMSSDYNPAARYTPVRTSPSGYSCAG
jgi:exopolysaccharide production protein ExoQ